MKVQEKMESSPQVEISWIRNTSEVKYFLWPTYLFRAINQKRDFNEASIYIWQDKEYGE